MRKCRNHGPQRMDFYQSAKSEPRVELGRERVDVRLLPCSAVVVPHPFWTEVTKWRKVDDGLVVFSVLVVKSNM